MHFFTVLPTVIVLLKCHFIRPKPRILWKYLYYVAPRIWLQDLLLTNFLLPDVELRRGKILHPARSMAGQSCQQKSSLNWIKWRDLDWDITTRKAPCVLVTDLVYIFLGSFLKLIYYRWKLSSEFILIVWKFSLGSEKNPQKNRNVEPSSSLNVLLIPWYKRSATARRGLLPECIHFRGKW